MSLNKGGEERASPKRKGEKSEKIERNDLRKCRIMIIISTHREGVTNNKEERERKRKREKERDREK